MSHQSVLLHGGTVYPTCRVDDRYEAIKFTDGVVDTVGTLTDASGAPEQIDLEGRVVIPGFHDAHTHVLWVGLYECETDLSGTKSRGDALDRLSVNADRTPPGEWVLGFGYDESSWTDNGRLRREDLDAVSSEHPVVAQRVDGHTLSVNTAALDRIPFDGLEGVERTESGDPTGIVVENAAGGVQRETYPDRERARCLLDAACNRLLELGVTSVQDMAGLIAPTGDGDPMHAAFHAAWRDGDLPIRIGYYVHIERAEELAALELASGFGDDWLRILGVKLFVDGSIGSRTAKLRGAYADATHTDGEFVIDPERLSAVLETAAERSQRVAAHAIGTPRSNVY